jgi:hypothetical protein
VFLGNVKTAMKLIHPYLKKLLKPPGADLREGVLFSYKNLFTGLATFFKGDIRFNHKLGKIGCYPLYPFEGSTPEEFNHELCIVAIVKNEGLYLKEWIEFHQLVGCTKFLIYDNGSTDNTKNILEFYQKKGVLDWIDWPHLTPWLNTQLLAYIHAIYTLRDKVRWVAFIDVDEFIFSPPNKDIRTFLKNYTDLPALIMYWTLFGTSGHEIRPQGLVTENYTRRLDATHPDNRFIPLSKSIVQPLRIRAVSSPHYFQTDHWPVLGYDENRTLMTKVSDKHEQNQLRIHHYYTKSLEDWNARISRPWASRGNRIDLKDSPIMKSYEAALNQIHKYEIDDTAIAYLIPELKKRMKKVDIT